MEDRFGTNSYSKLGIGQRKAGTAKLQTVFWCLLPQNGIENIGINWDREGLFGLALDPKYFLLC